MKSQSQYLDILRALITRDFVNYHGHPRDFNRDYSTIERRVTHQSFSFLTKELPKCGKALQQSLELGYFVFPGVFKKNPKTNLPVTFGKLYERIFNSDGTLRQDADHSAIQSLYQVFFMFYKLEFEFKEEDVDRCVEKFKSVCEDNRQPLSSQLFRILKPHVKSIIHKVLKKLNLKDIRPHHGPGAVATGEKPHEKYSFKRYYSELNSIYPFGDYFTVGSQRRLDHDFRTFKREYLASGSAKLIAVNKDSRGPRLISAEPLEYQWIQQGQEELFVELLESSRYVGGRINFRDQSVNQQLAVQSSVDRKLATTDLAEASDRVRLDVFNSLFPEHVRIFLNASRSHNTSSPKGEEIELTMFAPMGSAMCFPVLSLTVWAITLATQRYFGRQMGVERDEIESVFTYGDDLISSTTLVGFVHDALEAFGFRVNREKSFHKGHFRESCGSDAFKGTLLNPIRIKKVIPRKRADSSSIAAYHAYSESFFLNGYWETASAIDRIFEKLRIFRPALNHLYNSAGLVKSTFSSGTSATVKYNKDYQRNYFRCFFVVPKGVKQIKKDWDRLFKGIICPSKGFLSGDEVQVRRSTYLKFGKVYV